MNALALYGRYAAASVRAQFSYAGTLTMMSFGQVAGWSLGEVALFYGLVSITFAVSDTITRGFDIFGSVFVRTGGFDRLLLRPRSLTLQLLGYELRLTRIGRLAQGAAVFAYGAAVTHFAFTPAALAILAFALAGGVAMFSGLFVLQATLAFWTVESLEAVNIFTYGGEAAAEYPMNVYAGWFRNFLTFVVPVGCVTYLPMLAAMGRPDPLGAPAWVMPLAPAAGFAFLALALFIWRFGVRHYTSTGS